MSQVPGINTSDLRRLLIETSKVLQICHSFREIAELFFRGEVISSPEDPFPGYLGNKYEYAMEKLAAAKDLRPFLINILPEIFASNDPIWAESVMGSLVWAAEKVGYRLVTTEQEFKLSDGSMDGVEARDLIPPDYLLETSAITTEQKEYLQDNKKYPPSINKLISESNICLSNDCYNAAALLIRRIIFLSCVIYAKRMNFEDTLLNDDKDYHELSKLLSIVARHCPDISSQLLSRIQLVKWLGDYANHNKNWSASELELSSSLVNLRAFLSALFDEG